MLILAKRLEDLIYLKIYFIVSGITPRLLWVPFIVYVFPEDVCP